MIFNDFYRGAVSQKVIKVEITNFVHGDFVRISFEWKWLHLLHLCTTSGYSGIDPNFVIFNGYYYNFRLYIFYPSFCYPIVISYIEYIKNDQHFNVKIDSVLVTLYKYQKKNYSTEGLILAAALVLKYWKVL